MTENKDYGSLFTAVLSENKSLQNNIQILTDIYSTDDQKASYENDQIQWFLNANNFLYCVYFFLVLLFALIIIVKNMKYSIKMKTFMIIPLVIFPFIISAIEISMYNFISFIWSFIMVRAYPGNAFQ